MEFKRFKMESFGQWSSINKDQDVQKRGQIGLSDMPFEVLVHILGKMSFDDISYNRIVSKDFNQACCYALNSEFIRVKKEALKRHNELQKVMKEIKDPVLRAKHPLFKESTMIETVYMRLIVLNIKMGRHLERKEVCFYAGRILDEVNFLLNGEKSNLPNPTEELLKLCAMANQHFAYQIRPFLPKVPILERWDISMLMLITDPNEHLTCSVSSKDIQGDDDELIIVESYTFKQPDEIFSQMA